MLTGTVFDIQRFSTKDGSGIRTTVFLKGCPLRCRWCHNPEGQSTRQQVAFHAEKCIGCGRCARISSDTAMPAAARGSTLTPLLREAVQNCPSGALRIWGTLYTPDELMKELRRDLPFYGAQGGITFSGGDAASQPEFVLEMLARCKREGIHTAVDTCGKMPAEVLRRFLPLTDLFLYDLKAADAASHKKGTGFGNEDILQNLRILAENSARIWIRIPLVKGINAEKSEMQALCKLLLPYRETIEKITLIPYHDLGKAKYTALGLAAASEDFSVTDRMREEFVSVFSSAGFLVCD